MAVDIMIPSIGESITEGTIARWLKKDGEAVRRGEPLFELETDKATTDIPSPATGTLHIRATEGKTVAVGAAVGSIEEGAARPEPPQAKTPPVNEKEDGKAKEEKPKKEKPADAKTPRFEIAPERAPRREGDVPAEPARETESARQEPRPPVTESATNSTRQPMSAIRQRIAERLLASQRNTATLTTFNEADLSAILDLRARSQERFQKKHGVKLGLMSFFVKACAQAIRAYPIANARIEQSDIVFHHDCHIGVAISTDKGLFVPVLRHAERLSLAQIEKGIAEFADKARNGKIAVQDLQDGTFTITNGGVFGSLLSTPILNPPQSAILGMHTIQKRPVAVDDQIVIRPMMYLALSYDHRLIDGREAVSFLVRVKECVEDPMQMLLDV